MNVYYMILVNNQYEVRHRYCFLLCFLRTNTLAYAWLDNIAFLSASQKLINAENFYLMKCHKKKRREKLRSPKITRIKNNKTHHHIYEMTENAKKQ